MIKSVFPLGNWKINTKLGWEIRSERLLKKLWKKRKGLEMNNTQGYLGWKDQNKTTGKFNNTTWRDKPKDIGERNGTKQCQDTVRTIQTK